MARETWVIVVDNPHDIDIRNTIEIRLEVIDIVSLTRVPEPTAALLERYHANDDDDEALEELHKRAMAGDLQAREVLNDYDRDDPDWTPQTGSEGKD